MVEAIFAQGSPVSALIMAKHGSTLRLKNYCEDAFQIETSSFAKGETFSCQMTEGDTVAVTWNNSDPKPSYPLRPEVIYPDYKLAGPRTARLSGGHWHDESTGHGQVGLEKDGLFPATRWAKTR